MKAFIDWPVNPLLAHWTLEGWILRTHLLLVIH